MGYHDLFISRRKSESIDIQQMKQQALEIKTRRQMDRVKLLKEKEMRIEAEKKRDELQNKLVEYERQIQHSQEAILKAEETAVLLNERIKLAAEETQLLATKSSKLEAQANLYKLLAEKKDKEKRFFEYKTAKSELLLSHILDRTKSLNSVNGSEFDLRSNSNVMLGESQDNLKLAHEFRKLSIDDNLDTFEDAFESDTMLNSIKEQLERLKDEIKESRISHKITYQDSIYEKNNENGLNKYSTLNQIHSGSTKARVNNFEKL